jgi:hemin uptake protein HemP
MANGHGNADRNDSLETDASSHKTERPAVYSSEELLQGRSEAWIEHGEKMYRLRVTSKGNLILTR